MKHGALQVTPHRFGPWFYSKSKINRDGILAKLQETVPWSKGCLECLIDQSDCGRFREGMVLARRFIDTLNIQPAAYVYPWSS
jgi:hypothetical protein